jgi:predicted O-methyltransferase YrrM
MEKESKKGKTMDSGLSEWSEHVDFAKWLTDRVKPNLTVELGTFEGTSAMAFASGYPNGKVVTIDMKESEVARDSFEIFENIDYRVDTFENEVKNFEDDSIDILHVDGAHDFKSVVDDTMLWTPKLRDNGILLMHDVYNPGFIGPIHVFYHHINVMKIMFLKGYGLGVASRDHNLIREIYSKWPGDIVAGNALTEIYKFARINAEWIKESSELSAQEVEARGLKTKIDSNLMIDLSHLERWVS